MPKKTGRPPENDSLAIRRMVELRTANPRMKLRAVAREAARQLGLIGQRATIEDRLRHKYAEQEKAGHLPAVESSPDFVRSYMQDAYASRAAREARLREDLAAKEEEAIALGLRLPPKDLLVYLRVLEGEKENTEIYARGSAEIVTALLMEKGLSAAEADTRYLAIQERYQQLEKEVEVVRAIYEKRRALGLTYEFPPKREALLGGKPSDFPPDAS
ncbi:MAG TPA: hypothetical protein VHR45_21635 [Thermoanaerobaculia bacterium]|nr:hypothetical protein [Thermoanaerobaculia bacterium]